MRLDIRSVNAILLWIYTSSEYNRCNVRRINLSLLLVRLFLLSLSFLMHRHTSDDWSENPDYSDCPKRDINFICFLFPARTHTRARALVCVCVCVYVYISFRLDNYKKRKKKEKGKQQKAENNFNEILIILVSCIQHLYVHLVAEAACLRGVSFDVISSLHLTIIR